MNFKILICSMALIVSMAHAQDQRPNILVILADDLGFADLGCYGSEIETPRLDALADQGLRFSQFYSTAKCHSSRVCLLSGLYCNQAGSAKLNRCTTIANVLGDAGYFTSMTGKWHLAKEPTDFGFQKYWGHLSGKTDYFAGDDTFRLNGGPWKDFGEDFYTTDANVDWSMKFLDEALASGKPFFHYVAFNAPHYPLQAPKEDVEKYWGRYDVGWEEIRKARFRKQKELGLFPQSMELPPMPDHVPKWEELPDRQREFESFRMSVFAAMVDRLDRNIGRLIDYLEEKGVLENTLILFCSDNGACPFERSEHLEIPPWEAQSFYLYDASWATVGNTPLRHYKQTQHEGGISSPLIVHWPGHIKNTGGWERSQGHLIDIMATCLDIGDAKYPDSKEVEPLQGLSLTPLFGGGDRKGHDDLYFQFSSCRALRDGDWKAVSFYGQKWELYNIAEDRCEQNDLADKFPERTEAMAKRWHELAANVDRLPEKARGPVTEDLSNPTRDSWHSPEVSKSWVKPEI
ncbi:MAG: arylsulfatase [Candidatus Omnitrophica bacterium]|nr:arylsulfatase [Candidatus Omnitrophota bacterium]